MMNHVVLCSLQQHACGLIGNDHYHFSYFTGKTLVLSQFTLSRIGKNILYCCLPGISPVPIAGRISITASPIRWQFSRLILPSFFFFFFWQYKSKWNLNYKVATFYKTWIMWIWCSLGWRRMKEKINFLYEVRQEKTDLSRIT